MLVELGVVEQRYRAVLEVLEDGAPVTAVARRYGLARQTVHEWLRRYADEGLGGLADRAPTRRSVRRSRSLRWPSIPRPNWTIGEHGNAGTSSVDRQLAGEARVWGLVKSGSRPAGSWMRPAGPPWHR